MSLAAFGVVGAIAFVLVWFGVAYAAEHVGAFRRLAKHPVVYALSLGVFATSWTFSGSVGFAVEHGLSFAATPLGFSLACFCAPFLFAPLARVVHAHGAASLADLFAFRYASRTLGVAVTLLSLVASAPYLAVQVEAVAGASDGLGVDHVLSGALFSLLVLVFTLSFGVRDASTRERHPGLALAMGLDSVVKTVALGAVAVVAFLALRRSGNLSPIGILAFPEGAAGVRGPTWSTIVLLSALAAFVLPRQFHMAFVEAPRASRTSHRAMAYATWVTPLTLFAMSLAVPFILASGRVLAASERPDRLVFHVSREVPWVAALAFVGNAAAASSMMVVTALSCGTMVLHHVVLPLSGVFYRKANTPGVDVYRGLLRARRASVAFVIALGFVSFLVVSRAEGLVEIGLVSFVGSAQLAPGLLGVVLFRGASRTGITVGLVAGTAAWVLLLVVPLVFTGAGVHAPWLAALGQGASDPWTRATFVSLSLNVLGLVVGSIARPPGAIERDAAASCVEDALRERPSAAGLDTAEIENRLASLLDEALVRTELRSALREASLAEGPLSSVEANALRSGLEPRLAGYMGPLRARTVLDSAFAVERAVGPESALRALDEALTRTQSRITGPLAQIEAVRAWLRRLVDELPVGVVVLGARGDVVLWNRAMVELTAVSEAQATGRLVDALEPPWSTVLDRTTRPGLEEGGARVEEILAGSRSLLVRRGATEDGLLVLVVEDQTERRRLEETLAHQDKLGSLGRLVAGVGHEIGNPVAALGLVLERLHKELETSKPEALGEVDDALALVRRVRTILGDLRGYGRVVDGVTRERVPLANVVLESVRLLSLAGKRRGVEVLVSVPEDLVVLGDRARIAQIVVNLVDNALDESPEGSAVELHATVEGGRAVIEVRDDGPGIPEELASRIFEPFVTTKEVGKGTGLGLWVVWALVSHMGGEVSVDSAPGRGTVMTVKLDLAPTHDNETASSEGRP